jgi:hypothetical protein
VYFITTFAATPTAKKEANVGYLKQAKSSDPVTKIIRGLNLALVKLMTVQVTKLPL